MKPQKEIKILVEIDSKIVSTLCAKISYDTMNDILNDIEKVISKNTVSKANISKMFKISIEILQNIINYAHHSNSGIDGVFKASYSNETKKYTVNASNLVSKSYKKIIEERFLELVFLSEDKLKELQYNLIKTERYKHKKGAGLGFIIMARKSKNNLEISFDDQEDDLSNFCIQIVI